MINELIEIYRMEEINIDTRASLLEKMGQLINHEYGANITEPLVEELVGLLKKKIDQDFSEDLL